MSAACSSHLNGGPLVCDRTDPHTTGCTYTAPGAPDRHDTTEANAEETRG